MGQGGGCGPDMPLTKPGRALAVKRALWLLSRPSNYVQRGRRYAPLPPFPAYLPTHTHARAHARRARNKPTHTLADPFVMPSLPAMATLQLGRPYAAVRCAAAACAVAPSSSKAKYRLALGMER